MANLITVEMGSAKAEPTIDQLLTQCGSIFGRELTVYLGGGETVGAVGRWAEPADPVTHVASERLKLALAVNDVLLKVQRGFAVRAWLREVDPGLGSVSPATAIRHSTSSAERDRIYTRALDYVRQSDTVPEKEAVVGCWSPVRPRAAHHATSSSL